MTWQQTIDEEKEIAREEGFNDGFNDGFNNGFNDGIQQNAIATAKLLLADSVATEQIAKWTSLPLSQVLALKEEVSQK